MTTTITAKEYRRLVLKGIPKRLPSPHRAILTVLDGEAVQFGALALTVIPPSLNNAFLNTKKGRIKSPAYREWIARAQRDLRRQAGWHVPGKISVRLLFRKGETRADLDNLIKPCLDLLVGAGRIADDRNVVEVCARFASDLKGVRIELEQAASVAARPAVPVGPSAGRVGEINQDDSSLRFAEDHGCKTRRGSAT